MKSWKLQWIETSQLRLTAFCLFADFFNKENGKISCILDKNFNEKNASEVSE